MDQKEVAAWIEGLIERGELWRFYKSKQWKKLKRQVLEDNHYECEVCKKAGRVKRFDRTKDGELRLLSTVHHVQHVRDHPELALSRIYKSGDREYINLIPVCKACHNALHPEKNAKKESKTEKYMNIERW